MGMMTMTHLRRSRLSALALKTALGTSLVVLALPAGAQVSPDTVPLAPGSNRPQTRFDTVANGAGGQTLTVDLRNRPSTVISWRSFDIGADSVARFVSTNGDVANLSDPFSVLNRVSSGNPTTILGRLTSQPNIAVFLQNGSGIIFGAGSVVSTGAFVASTLNIDARAFGRGVFRFQQGEGGMGAPITVAAGSALRSTGTDGMRRGVVLVSPTIDSAGVVNGGGGDVAFVSAADATLSFRPGSPLGITIARGAPVQASQVVGGTVQGQNVYLALATQADATASLLRIDGNVRAVGTGNGVVIVGGELPGDAPGVVFRRGSAGSTTSGRVDIAQGAASAVRSSTDVAIAGRGSADIQGLVAAREDLTATLLGAADLGGRSLAGGDVSVTAASIEAAKVRAGGALFLRSTEGALTLGIGTAGAGATLRAADDLTVLTRLETGDTARLLTGGDARLRRVTAADGTIFVAAQAGEVTGVTAGSGAVLLAGGAGAVGVRAAGAVRLDRASAAGQVAVRSETGAITGGRLQGEEVSLTAEAGDVTIGGVSARAGLRVVSGGNVSVGRALRANGPLTVLSGETADIGIVSSAGGTVRIRAADIALGRASAAGSLRLDALEGDLALRSGSVGLTARLLAAGDAIIARTLTAGGQVTVRSGADASFGRLQSTGDDVKVSAASIDGGGASTAAVLRLVATDGDVTLRRAGAGTTAFLSSGGSVSVTGPLTAGSRLTVRAGQDAGLGAIDAGGSIFLDAALGDLTLGTATAGRRVVLSAGGDARATGAVRAEEGLAILADGDVALDGASTQVGTLRIAGRSIDMGDADAGGRLTLTATSGAVSLASGTAGEGADLMASGDVRVRRRLSADEGVDVRAGSVARLGAVTAGAGRVTVSGNRVRVGTAEAARGLSLEAAAGPVRLDSATAGGAIAITAGTALDVRGAISAGRDVAIRAERAATLSDVSTERGDVQVTVGRVALGNVTAGGALGIEATRGQVSLGSAAVGGAGRIVATRGIVAGGPVAAREDLALTAGGAVTLDTARARRGDLAITGRSVSAAGLTAGATLAIEAERGTVALGGASAGGAMRINGAGDVTAAGTLVAGEGLSLRAGGSASLANVRSGGGDLVVSARGVDMGRAASNAGVTLSARTSDLVLAGATAGGDLALTAGGTIEAAGRVTAGGAIVARAGDAVRLAGVRAGVSAGAPGDLRIRADAIALDTARAGGSLDLRARAGDLSLRRGSAGAAARLTATGSVIVAQRLAGARATIDAGGAARLGTIIGTDAGVTIGAEEIGVRTIRASGPLTLDARAGAVTARTLVSGGNAAITASEDMRLRGALTAGGTAVLTTGGDARLGAITAERDLTVTAAGAVRGNGGVGASLAARGSGDVRVAAGGRVDLAALDAGGRALVQGAEVTADSVSAGGALRVRAEQGALDVGTAAAGGAAILSAARNLVVRERLDGGGIVRLDAGGAARLASVTAGDDLTIVAARDVRGLAGPGAALATNGAGDVRVTAGGAIDLARVSSGGALTLTATGGPVVMGEGLSAGAATVRAAGDLRVRRSLGSGGAVELTSGGSAQLGSVTAGGDLSVAAAEDFGGWPRGGAALVAQDGGRIRLQAGGSVDLAMAEAGGRVRVTGATIDVDRISSAGPMALTATAGRLAIGDGAAGGRATLDAAGDIVVRSALESGGVVAIASGGDARLGSVSAAGDLTVTAAGGIGGSGAPGTTLVAQGGDVRLTARDAVRVAALDAGGGAVVRGWAISADEVTTGGVLRMRSDGGAIDLGTGTAGGSAILSAARDLTVREGLESGGTARLDAGRSARLALVGAADDVTIVAAGDVRGVTASGGTVIANGAGDVRIEAGGTIDLARLASGGLASVTGARISADRIETTGPLSMTATAGRLALDEATIGDTAVLSAAGPLTVRTGLTSGGAATLSAGGDMRLGTVSALDGALTLTAGGAVAGRGDTGASLFAGGSDDGRGHGLSVMAGGAVHLADARAEGDVTVDAASIDIGTAAAGSAEFTGSLVLSAREESVVLGEGAASAAARIHAETGVTLARALTAGTDVGLTAGGAIAAGRIEATNGSVRLDAGGDVLGASGRPLVLVAGGAGGLVVGAAGAIDVNTATSAAGIDLTGASVSAGTLRAANHASLRSTVGDVAVDDGEAGGTATLVAAGTLTVGTGLTTGGTADLRAGGDARLARVETRDGALTVTAGGAVSGVPSDGGARLVAGGSGGDLSVTAQTSVRIADAVAGGAATIRTQRTGNAALGTIDAAGSLLVETGALAAGSLIADAVIVDAGGTATIGRGEAGGLVRSRTGDLHVTAAELDVARADAAGNFSLTAITGPLALGSGEARGTATLLAGGIVTLGTPAPAPGLALGAASVSITAADLQLQGLLRAERSATIRSGAAGLTLGDGPTGGLHLADAEVGFLDAPELVFDAGAGPVRMGTVSFGAQAGEGDTIVATTGAVEVTGAVTAAADGRTIMIGGAAGEGPARAERITIVANAASGAATSAGGRLTFDGNTLHLRADRIAAGQNEGFLDVLGGLTDARAVADRFVNNARSALYAATQPYPDAPVLVSARSMTVDYGTYALFQNTGRLTTAAGVNGSRTGVVLGVPGEGPSLTLRSDGAGGGNTFALFGTIAGVSNEAAAVVGQTILSTRINGEVETIVIQDSRVNGCIIGTGAGCLTTPIGIPPINIFDPSRLNVFVPADFEIAFDPVIGSNNEALFAGIAAIDVPSESELPFDPAIGSNNEALFTGAADDAAAGEDGCPEDRTGKTCPRKESRQ